MLMTATVETWMHVGQPSITSQNADTLYRLSWTYKQGSLCMAYDLA